MKRFMWLLCVLFVPSVLHASDYYVDPLYGKTWNNGSYASPWKTLQEIFQAPTVKFLPGDTIWLRRGVHGEVTVRGINNGMVKIAVEKGHTAVLGRLVFSQARYWSVEGVHVLGDAVAGGVQGQALVEFNAGSTGNMLVDATVASFLEPRAEAVLQKPLRVGVHFVSGARNVLGRTHVLNVSKGVVAQASMNKVERSVFEHVLGYVWEVSGGGNVWEYNTVYNMLRSEGPSGWMNVSGNGRYNQVVRLNTVVASLEPNNTYYKQDASLIDWHAVDVANILVQGNVMMSQNDTCVYVGSAYNVLVSGNTCVSLKKGVSQPVMKVGQSDARRFAAAKNLLFNNIAGGYVLLNWDGSSPWLENGGNVAVHPEELGAFFVSQGFPRLDVHLTEQAALAIGTAEAAYVYPLDRDGYKRPSGESADAGAFEYGYVTEEDTENPSAVAYPKTVWIPHVGLDVLWESSSDNRGVVGYDVYKNGTHVARIRSGTHFLDKGEGFSPGLVYTVKAFDASGNRSF